MNKRNRNYILFLSTIAVLFFLAYIARTVGITIQSGLTNAITTVLFYSPIVGFLLYLSSDIRLKKAWRIILRILSLQMALANIIGIIISWLT